VPIRIADGFRSIPRFPDFAVRQHSLPFFLLARLLDPNNGGRFDNVAGDCPVEQLADGRQDPVRHDWTIFHGNVVQQLDDVTTLHVVDRSFAQSGVHVHLEDPLGLPQASAALGLYVFLVQTAWRLL
jgi:hypothetical protein